MTISRWRSVAAVLSMLAGLAACDARVGSTALRPGSDDVTAGPDARIHARVWRLSPAQYNGEIQRLLPGAPAVAIPASAGEEGFSSIASSATIDIGNAGLFANGAREVGRWAAQNGATSSRCTDYGTDACIASFLEWFPAAAFRRAVTDDERRELRELFDGLRSEYDYDYAFTGVVRAVLTSPDFLYRTELGEDLDATRRPLGQYEIANLIAFSVTDQSPDAELITAAREGRLTDADEREEHVRRLISRSAPVWQRFFWEWLKMSTLQSQGVEVGLSQTMIDQMAEEYRAFVEHIAVEQGGTLHDLFGASYTWARPELAAHYGANHPGGGLARIELDPEERGGLLTLGAWLVSHGKRGRDNVVRRGMNVFISAMCNNIAPPTDLNLDEELGRLVGPDATVREIVEARGQAPRCGRCHQVPDPVGLVFETYTSDGRFQTTYADGRPVDSTIAIGTMGTFDRAPVFSAALADDPSFQRCFVRRFAHFVAGVDLGSPEEIYWTRDAHARFVESGTSLEELLVALVRHPAFIERSR